MRHLYYSFNDTIYQWSTGAAYLHLLYDLGTHRLITGVECEFPEIKEKQIALLDTGAELSVAGNEIYQVFSALGSLSGNASISRACAWD